MTPAGSAWTEERRHSRPAEGAVGVQQTNSTNDGGRKRGAAVARLEQIINCRQFHTHFCCILSLI